MEKFNVNVVLCKKFDEETQSAVGIMNVIDLDKQAVDNKVTVNFVTFMSGFGDEVAAKFALDFYIKCVKDTAENIEENFSGKFSYLFTMSMEEDVEATEELEKRLKSSKASYARTFQSIGQIEKKISLPSTGRYEIQVFRLPANSSGDARERYKEYKAQKESPVSICYFDVI